MGTDTSDSGSSLSRLTVSCEPAQMVRDWYLQQQTSDDEQEMNMAFSVYARSSLPAYPVRHLPEESLASHGGLPGKGQ